MRNVDCIGYLFILILTLLNQTSSGYKILGVFPHGGKSHFFVFAPILRELARRGHEVTVISHFPEKNPLPNYTDISIIGAGRIGFNNIPVSAFSDGIFKNIFRHIQLAADGQRNCEALNYPQIQNLVRSNKTFDLILQENFNSDCFMALNYIFQAPSIGLSSCTVMTWLHARFGIPVNPSYRPITNLPHGDKMTFYQRVSNTVYYFIHGYLIPVMFMTKQDDIAVRKYLGANIPSVADIAKNTSLFLINTHYTLNKAWAYPPNVIEISGVHLDKPKALPDDIENFISESPHGVIYFSLGSMILGSSLSDDVKQAFMDAFKELPQRILWKYEGETLPGKPDNVMIRKWMPQLDILSHPNVVGFISHSGLLGIIEAFYNGVPIVSIPFFGDQFHNAKTLESHGTAAILDAWNLKKDSISKALNFILQPRVLEKAKRQARLFRDRPESPLDTAIWWIEYVARNGGAHETRPAVVNMPFYQSALLDVGLFLLTVILIVVYINFKLSKLILSKLFSQNKQKKD
ncbi:UDP-glycosyltransferase UGT5-like [Chrysoperla carnea]|uniref:UDP-glycosyltransferase UGT5-like n=1 Tax=Chrysoperla carnea TaxID=189513 RepID=UPI001D06CCD3|nr:UDP-glycosyltransferase UGT5-like [Chrysoperla carnea]